MRNFCFIILTFLVLLLVNCKKQDNNSGPETEILPPPTEEFVVDTFPIHVFTNKEEYQFGEDVKVQAINLSDSLARYFICSPYMGNVPYVDRWELNSWQSYWSIPCDGYNSYCCKELKAGEFLKDTLPIELHKGYYRITYSFIVRPSNQYTLHHSNIFQIN